MTDSSANSADYWSQEIYSTAWVKPMTASIAAHTWGRCLVPDTAVPHRSVHTPVRRWTVTAVTIAVRAVGGMSTADAEQCPEEGGSRQSRCRVHRHRRSSPRSGRESFSTHRPWPGTSPTVSAAKFNDRRIAVQRKSADSADPLLNRMFLRQFGGEASPRCSHLRRTL